MYISEPNRLQLTIRRMHISCWIRKDTNTLSENVILIVFPQQQWLHERVSLLRYTYNPCLVFSVDVMHFACLPKRHSQTGNN